MNCDDIDNIPKEKFVFVQRDDATFAKDDSVLAVPPASYLHDALSRFAKNRGSVICFFIIFVLFLYAVFAPLFSPFRITDKDGYYAYATPRLGILSGTSFWDGGRDLEVNLQTYQYLSNIPGAVKKFYGTRELMVAKRPQTWYALRVDTYEKVGWVKLTLTPEQWAKAKEWEASNGVQLFYPVLDDKQVKNSAYKGDVNAWFLTDDKGVAKKSATGELTPIYVSNEKSPDGFAYYIPRMNGSQYEVRVLYKEWYHYLHGRYASFLFGADMAGYDIFTRLAHGARLSLFLSIIVSAINLLLGTVIGALEGYYGGSFDLTVERIKDIICQVPSQVTMVLFQLYLADKLGPLVALFFAFIFYGWIGTSSTVRAQFYRFKGQDYISASRTLGAKDSRLIFKHILPNAIGFIITASVLKIPAVIFSEANLTYLGIVNLDSDTMTSVGTMLNSAKDALATYPHTVFFPALFISLLLVCFNEFGNGLRDAFNPQLRGSENE